MNESEWLNSTDPQAMVEFLRVSGRASERKLRLFSCACVRHVWCHLADESSREAVRIAERFADHSALVEEVALGNKAAWHGHNPDDPASMAALLASAGLRIHPALAAWGTASAGADSAAASRIVRLDAWGKGYATWDIALAWADGDVGQAWNWRSHITLRHAHDDDLAQSREREAQAALLRDVFGNPFRPPPPLAPAVLQWQGGTVVRLARAAYEQRELPSGHLDRHRLAVLADAVEEAGGAAELVAHLREPGPHVRGCWCVDLLLGKS